MTATLFASRRLRRARCIGQVRRRPAYGPTLTSSTRLTASMQALHNAGRLAWGSGPRGEKPDYTGLDVIIVRGDKIAALYVFLDSMPS